METGIIPDRNGNPRIWNVNRNDDGDTWLNDNNGHDDNTWDPDNEFVFSNSFIISKNQHYDVGFLIALFTCPYHPPSILPISSSGTLTCAYALCEIDLFSHNIIINTFNVSSFRIDCLIHGAFSDLSRNVATDMDSIMSVKSKSIFCPTVYLWVLSSPTYRLYQILYTDFVLINIGKKLRGGGNIYFMKILFVHTYNNIITIENLLCSWEHFRRDKKSKTDVQEFERDLMQNIIALYNDLKNKTYTHSRYSHFKINDPKPRDIHKASVRDRVVHHLLYSALYPYFDTKFIHDSYSCRINKGTHRALQQFQNYFRKVSKNDTRTCWVLKCDIRKFFATIDHGILKQILRSYINDRDTIGLLENIVDSFCTERSVHGFSFRDDPVGDPVGSAPQSGEEYDVIRTPSARTSPLPLKEGDENTNTWIPDQVRHDNAKFKPPPPRASAPDSVESPTGSLPGRGGKNTTTKGLPLGNLTSQLLVNIYMNKFDQFVKHQLKQKYYIRYADDFVFLSENKNELKELLPRVQKFLWESLRLDLHPDKVFIKTAASGVDFLGWIEFCNYRTLRSSTRKRMFRNLKNNNYKKESVDSYIGLLKHGNTYRLQGKIKIY